MQGFYCDISDVTNINNVAFSDSKISSSTGDLIIESKSGGVIKLGNTENTKITSKQIISDRISITNSNINGVNDLTANNLFIKTISKIGNTGTINIVGDVYIDKGITSDFLSTSTLNVKEIQGATFTNNINMNNKNIESVHTLFVNTIEIGTLSTSFSTPNEKPINIIRDVKLNKKNIEDVNAITSKTITVDTINVKDINSDEMTLTGTVKANSFKVNDIYSNNNNNVINIKNDLSLGTNVIGCGTVAATTLQINTITTTNNNGIMVNKPIKFDTLTASTINTDYFHGNTGTINVNSDMNFHGNKIYNLDNLDVKSIKSNVNGNSIQILSPIAVGEASITILSVDEIQHLSTGITINNDINMKNNVISNINTLKVNNIEKNSGSSINLNTINVDYAYIKTIDASGTLNIKNNLNVDNEVTAKTLNIKTINSIDTNSIKITGTLDVNNVLCQNIKPNDGTDKVTIDSNVNIIANKGLKVDNINSYSSTGIINIGANIKTTGKITCSEMEIGTTLTVNNIITNSAHLSIKNNVDITEKLLTVGSINTKEIYVNDINREPDTDPININNDVEIKSGKQLTVGSIYVTDINGKSTTDPINIKNNVDISNNQLTVGSINIKNAINIPIFDPFPSPTPTSCDKGNIAFFGLDLYLCINGQYKKVTTTVIT